VYKTASAIICILLSTISYGLDVKVSNQVDTVYINLSLKDPNVISVDNDRIQRYVTRKGIVAGSIEPRTGVLTLTPQDISKKMFSLVIFTEKGKRYTLLSLIKDIPSQDIILKTSDIVTKIDKSDDKNSFKTNKLSQLLVAMQNEEVPLGYKYKELLGNPHFETNHLKQNKDVNIKRFIGKDFTGEIIDFKNVLNSQTKIYEKEFISKDVLAVSIEKSTLEPNEFTKIYRVIKNG